MRKARTFSGPPAIESRVKGPGTKGRTPPSPTLNDQALGQLAGEARWISAGTNWPQVSLPTSM